MKKTILLCAIAATLFGSCKKETNVTVINSDAKPAYAVYGLQDITLVNGTSANFAEIGIEVAYLDSAQDNISLSVSGLPAGITIDTAGLISGIPTFQTYLYFFDTTAAGAAPGRYPVKLICTGSSGNSKSYTFNIKVLPTPNYATAFIGQYTLCYNYCTGVNYADSITADPTIVNKVWFHNFLNYGISVYGMASSSGTIAIPTQTAGSYAISGGTAYPVSSGGSTGLSVSATFYTGGTYNSCDASMMH